MELGNAFKKYGDAPDSALQEIAALYEQTLDVPDEKPVRQFLLCPVGLVGAGKSTVLKPLAERLLLVRVSSDELRKLFKERGYSYQGVHEIAFRILEKLLEQGHSLAIDADCANPDTHEKINELVTRFHVKAIWIYINPPESFIIDKLMNFKHTWLFKDGEDAVHNYYARKPLHDHLNMPFIYTFDTSRPDLPQQITEAERTIRKEISR